MTFEYHADLHIHTVLSACAEVEMIPPLIVDEARHKGLDIIAITDHNTTEGAAAVIEAAAGEGESLLVLPGMELLTREEVDVLCLFETLEQAQRWQAYVDDRIPPLENDAEHFGPQFVVDAEGDFVREDTRMRKMPAVIGVEKAAEKVHALGGLVIPAHIERMVYGLMYVLGLWPAGLEVDAVEVSHNLRPSAARERFSTLPADMPIITNSDAHFLSWIGTVSSIFVLEAPPTLEELRLAFQGVGERRVYVP